MQQADVLVNDHPVENILDDQRRNDPQHLNHERREKEVRQDLLVGLQVADESDPWGASAAARPSSGGAANSRQVPLQPRSNSSTSILRKPTAGSATHTWFAEMPYTTT